MTFLIRIRRWCKACSLRRRNRLVTLRRARAKRELDRVEKSLEDLMYSLPHGRERRQCNNELLMLRTRRFMMGI